MHVAQLHRPHALGAPEVELLYLDGSVTGSEALALVQTRLAAGNLRIVAARLRQAARPLRVSSVVVKDPEKKSSFSLAALVPLILVLMTITGAVYPSIDLTAGERERGTLEVLMASPVPRVRLLLAKYAAVFR